MVKKSIYPKTKRLGTLKDIIITEKLDGSNLAFFKKEGIVYIATRNNILNTKEDLIENKNILYKGLQGWLEQNLYKLEEVLVEGSVICGEWIGMGKLKYPNLDKRFYIFAKANLEDDMTLKNINYTHDFFKYCFANQEIPNFIGIVPVVKTVDFLPSVQDMDQLYNKYTEHENRDIEGFVICNNNTVLKYVRMKNGKIEAHFS